jgi:hypothetical protein
MQREAVPCSHAVLGSGFSVTVKDRRTEAPVESEHLLFPGSGSDHPVAHYRSVQCCGKEDGLCQLLTKGELCLTLGFR